MPGTLVLICGLPGSGKTTLAKQMAARLKAIHFCPDAWVEALIDDPYDIAKRNKMHDDVEILQWMQALEYLSYGYTVILDNGFWAEEERSQYAMEALEIGARIELIYMNVPHDELWRRILARNEILPNPTFVMTREEAEESWRVFETPSDEELGFYDRFEVVKLEGPYAEAQSRKELNKQ